MEGAWGAKPMRAVRVGQHRLWGCAPASPSFSQNQNRLPTCLSFADAVACHGFDGAAGRHEEGGRPSGGDCGHPRGHDRRDLWGFGEAKKRRTRRDAVNGCAFVSTSTQRRRTSLAYRRRSPRRLGRGHRGRQLAGEVCLGGWHSLSVMVGRDEVSGARQKSNWTWPSLSTTGVHRRMLARRSFVGWPTCTCIYKHPHKQRTFVGLTVGRTVGLVVGF